MASLAAAAIARRWSTRVARSAPRPRQTPLPSSLRVPFATLSDGRRRLPPADKIGKMTSVGEGCRLSQDELDLWTKNHEALLDAIEGRRTGFVGIYLANLLGTATFLCAGAYMILSYQDDIRAMLHKEGRSLAESATMFWWPSKQEEKVRVRDEERKKRREELEKKKKDKKGEEDSDYNSGGGDWWF